MPDVKNGIDVSSHQGDINWSKVNGDAGFVFIKATEGVTFEDPRFTDARVKAVERELDGFRVGYYHFARPDNNRARDEAEHFVRVVKSRGGRIGRNGVLDYEIAHPGGDDEAWVAAWVDRYKELTGDRPWIYGYGSSLSRLDTTHGCPLWLAAYTPSPDPYIPSQWRSGDHRLRIWQYSSTGRCDGISGNVDRNKFYGDADELRNAMA